MNRPLFEVRRYRDAATTHSHPYHQAVLALNGRLDMTIGQLEGSVAADSLALIAAEVSHSFRGTPGSAFLVIDIPAQGWSAGEDIGQSFWAEVRERPFLSGGNELGPFVRYLAAATQQGQLRGENLSNACALLLGIISAQLGIDAASALPAGLRAVRGYVDTHLEWSLSVAELARIGNVSVSRLHALFRKHFDTTPREYVSRRRLERACGLLESTPSSIASIAQRVGYADQAAFTRAFRRFSGVTPGQHRSAFREKGHKVQ